MADLLQILKGTSGTVTETFEIDGAPINVDAGLPTLAISRPDATAYTPLPTVLDTWAGPPARTTGQYRCVLPRQLECTWLDYELTGTIGGQPQTLGGRVEWLGATLFNISAMRALKVAGSKPFESTTTWPDAKLHEARAATLILAFSPVPRFARETVDGDGLWSVVLPHLKCHDLLSVTVNGVAQSVGSYTLRRSGILEATSGYVASGTFTAGRQNVVVEYVHGEPRVMGNGGHMAMMFAAADLDPSGFSNGATVTTPDGVSYTYEPSETGRGGVERPTGIRIVDRWLRRWGQAAGWAA